MKITRAMLLHANKAQAEELAELRARMADLENIIARARDWVDIDGVADRILREVSREDASHE